MASKNDVREHEVLIEPLRKLKLGGSLYTRPSEVEAKLLELASLSCDELITYCELRQGDPAYVPSECLLHFVRSYRARMPDICFEKLYKFLIERVLSSCSNKISNDDKTSSLIHSNIRDEVVGRFAELLAHDFKDYVEKLDYYEIRFNDALKKMYIDVYRQVKRGEDRLTSLDDQVTGEPKIEVERAAGSFEPFNTSAFTEDDYRSCLYAAIDTLPPLEKKIIEMLRLGFPIDSKDPNVTTISRTLSKSEKTIRTYRNKAFATIRTILEEANQI